MDPVKCMFFLFRHFVVLVIVFHELFSLFYELVEVFYELGSVFFETVS